MVKLVKGSFKTITLSILVRQEVRLFLFFVDFDKRERVTILVDTVYL